MKLMTERLKELLHYNSETGIFLWKKQKGNRVKIGGIAGCINKRGYRTIRIDGKLYNASRLAFLYMEGYWPEHDVDHINRVKHDNRWKNLRHVSHQCNSRNCNVAKNNVSGITGVCWLKEKRKWHAQIAISGKVVFLGYFKSKLNAAKARWNAEVKHGFPNCNTTSMAYQYIQKEALNEIRNLSRNARKRLQTNARNQLQRFG